MAIAAYGMVICGGSDELHQKYRGRIEKVKFGVPIHEAFVHDIPATLLVNKEGPLKKDIWRAPGNQAQVRKLANIMQHGRLVNISNISVYTAASVIKKFLSKLPGGIFGAENEQILFNSFQSTINDEQRQTFCRVVCSLPLPSQHLLVLLFGTFRIIADSAQTFNTRMTPDAIGISVAPSLFLTCMHDEHRAKLEDIVRFKAASQIISKIIQSFGYTNLFTRECYEFYARITGRTLRVDESYQFSFVYPSNSFSKPDETTFSSMMSTITAALAARSYSLETIGQHPIQTTTPPLLRPQGIQRGGSLKLPTPTNSFTSTDMTTNASTSRQTQQPNTNFNGSVANRCQRGGSNTSEQPRRIIMGERTNVFTTPPSSQRRPPASLLFFAGTFSQPSICFAQTSAAESGTEQDQPGPSGLQRQPTTSSRRRSDETEGDDVYSDELPGSSRFAHPRRDRAASASGANDPQLHHSGYWRHPSRDPFSDLFDQSKLSTSMGEVLLHSEYERAIGESLSDRPSGQPSPHSAAMSSRCAESLESTRSLTYLEWVHEKQTKRMKSRSEWFLSPAMPPKNGGASKSFDFHSHFQHSPSPMHQKLRLPETDTDRSLQSSTEEIMRTGSSYSSGKEQRPVSPILIVESSLEPMDKKLEEAVVLSGETTPRLPFQMLQHHSGESDDAPLSATPPARQQPPMFFAEDAPPTKTSKSDSSSGSQSQKSILIGPSATTQSQQQPSSTGGLTRVSSIGVVRRKSWRTHYVRPNKSLDQESAPKEEVGLTSHSTPAASTRRSSANGDSNTKLIRRKSSSNSAQSSKVPVQARLSTQI
ncbi:RhoGAP domain protein [Aphelenchoides bicaudatus]|nr:RhoGAP domain protein [Aphelenchoides bicaudatus]